ncbi:MAG: site-specific DNA-methyltransferase [Anaerolineae bacterium]|nr:site-specific DNA-methyltransferase [Anaerolineae bacterium]
MARSTTNKPKQVESLRHGEAKRPNIPTAEYEPVVDDDLKRPILVAYERRNPDLDPQLVWRGKDLRDWSELVVPAPPLYIQEKIHPQALIADLLRQSRARAAAGAPAQLNLFADFNGIPTGATGTDFYRHNANWSNRLILGDSLQVMASLAEREGLRGQVQCIYIDPPYGIRFNSNFQWSTTSRDVKDGRADNITREPEQVKAFRDTWRDGIHSYLTYLRDRLTVARDLLAESGSIFVQIGDENVHRVRAMMDEVLGSENFISEITFVKTAAQSAELLPNVADTIIWYAKNREGVKYRQLYRDKMELSTLREAYSWTIESDGVVRRTTREESSNLTLANDNNLRCFRLSPLSSQRPPGYFPVEFQGLSYLPGKQFWKTHKEGFSRLYWANRLHGSGKTLFYRLFLEDFPGVTYSNNWTDTQASFSDKIYIVQTSTKVIQRCILMTTDPGDLVLDPTCGSGTTAFVAEQWGRRWITIDTSRVALALARARVMGARYPYYLLADSRAGQQNEAELRGAAPASAPTFGDIRHGFVYERVPHVTLKAIANNAEIDVIWERFQPEMEALRAEINRRAGQAWAEWEVPRAGERGRGGAGVEDLLAQWWALRIERQRAIDASIAAAADQEFLYDRPYQDKAIVRVAGPFTVESLSPHRVLVVDADDELQPLDGPIYGHGRALHDGRAAYAGDGADFTAVILENLRTAGVQQAHKEGRITFAALTGWPGTYICAEGRYLEEDSGVERRAGVFIGPEFGTVARPDLVAAAREAADAGFDVLIACAFNYDAHSAEFERLGRIPILKARMNADLHMAGDLANTGAGNLFVIFGEPDIAIRDAGDGQIEVEIRGVDVFHPQSGEVRSSGPDGIACWFIDTDYNEESFFVRQAYFLGMNDPYGALKTTLKAEIDAEAWESLYRAVSRPFPRPATGRIAVKVINHLGDEVMKVFSVA